MQHRNAFEQGPVSTPESTSQDSTQGGIIAGIKRTLGKLFCSNPEEDGRIECDLDNLVRYVREGMEGSFSKREKQLISDRDLKAVVETILHTEGDHLADVNILDAVDQAGSSVLPRAVMDRITNSEESVTLLGDLSESESGDPSKALEAVQKHLASRKRVKTIRNEGPRIGRNDPCPCGSGRKHKKCCDGKTKNEETAEEGNNEEA